MLEIVIPTVLRLLVSIVKAGEIYGFINSLEASFPLSLSPVGCVSFEVMVT